jgi:hypothetical protein
VPSFISGCAAVKMLEAGIFARCRRGVRARSEDPLFRRASSPLVPFFLALPEGAGGIPGPPPQNLFQGTNT